MAPSMACAPTQTEYSHKGRVSSGGTPSAGKPAPKESATKHDTPTRLNTTPQAPHDHPQPRGHTGRHGVRSWVQTNQHTDERNSQHRLPAGENQVRERHS